MQLEIINNSEYKNIKIVCNNTEYNLNDSIIINSNYICHIIIYTMEKNHFYFDLPGILTSSITHKDTWCDIICNLEFDIEGTNEKETIVINDKCCVFKKRFTYKTVEVNSTESVINNIKYFSTDTKDIIKKHNIFNLFLTSLLPIILIDFVFSVVNQSILFFFAGLIGFLFLSVPSFADIKKFNKICKNSDVTQIILQSEQ